MIVVREATAADTGRMGALWCEWAKLDGKEDPNVDLWTELERRGLEEHSLVAIVAYHSSGKLVGFTDGVIGYEPGTREVFLAGRHLYLTPDARGRGIGERMQIRLLALANQCGAGYMLTHGTPSGHSFEKLFGIPMTPHSQVRIARWGRK